MRWLWTQHRTSEEVTWQEWSSSLVRLQCHLAQVHMPGNYETFHAASQKAWNQFRFQPPGQGVFSDGGAGGAGAATAEAEATAATPPTSTENPGVATAQEGPGMAAAPEAPGMAEPEPQDPGVAPDRAQVFPLNMEWEETYPPCKPGGSPQPGPQQEAAPAPGVDAGPAAASSTGTVVI
eukprot:s366_g63.t1